MSATASGADDRPAAPADANRPILLGRISGVFGVRGEIKIESWTDPREAIFGYQPWSLVRAGTSSSMPGTDATSAGPTPAVTRAATIATAVNREIERRNADLGCRMSVILTFVLPAKTPIRPGIRPIPLCRVDGPAGPARQPHPGGLEPPHLRGFQEPGSLPEGVQVRGYFR